MLRGQAGRELLGTYSAERAPVARQIVTGDGTPKPEPQRDPELYH